MKCISIVSSSSVVRGAEVSKEPNVPCAVFSSLCVMSCWEGLCTGQSDSPSGTAALGSCRLAEDGGGNCEDDSGVS